MALARLKSAPKPLQGRHADEIKALEFSTRLLLVRRTEIKTKKNRSDQGRMARA
jgi:hypothetical protein